MRRLPPEHFLHRALCVLLCVVLVLSGGLGVPPIEGAAGGCATEQSCCCDDTEACAGACACAAPSAPAAPKAPLVASPSLVDLATPPPRDPVAVEDSAPPAPRAWHTTVAGHALPARALHVAHCVFLC